MITVYVIESLSDKTWYTGMAIDSFNVYMIIMPEKTGSPKVIAPGKLFISNNTPIGILPGKERNI
jgi:hypothetical protein